MHGDNVGCLEKRHEKTHQDYQLEAVLDFWRRALFWKISSTLNLNILWESLTSCESLGTVSFQDGHVPQMNKIKQVLKGWRMEKQGKNCAIVLQTMYLRSFRMLIHSKNSTFLPVCGP